MTELITYETASGADNEISLDFQETALKSLSEERREYFQENEYEYEQYISLYHTYTIEYPEPHIPFNVFERQIETVEDIIEKIFDVYCADNREWFERYLNLERLIGDLTDEYTMINHKSIIVNIPSAINRIRGFMDATYAIDMNDLYAE